MRRLAALLLAAACSSGGPQQPLDQLDEAGFWRLVAQAAEQAGPKVLDRAAVVTQLLSTADARRLESWQQQLVARVEAVRTAPVAAAFRELCGAPQELVDYGPWLVAQGEEVYEQVRADPSRLAEQPSAPTACEGTGEAFAVAALARYSSLGFEPGTEAFPFVTG